MYKTSSSHSSYNIQLKLIIKNDINNVKKVPDTTVEQIAWLFYGPINFAQAQVTNYDFDASCETDSSLLV